MFIFHTYTGTRQQTENRKSQNHTQNRRHVTSRRNRKL